MRLVETACPSVEQKGGHLFLLGVDIACLNILEGTFAWQCMTKLRSVDLCCACYKQAPLQALTGVKSLEGVAPGMAAELSGTSCYSTRTTCGRAAQADLTHTDLPDDLTCASAK